MAAAHNEEHLNSGLECAICLELLCEPMQLPCSHIFCRKCLSGMVRQKRHCALCRADIPESFDPTSGALHKPIEQILMRQCTLEYTQRLEDVAMEAARLVRLNIRNTHDFLGFNPRPKHQWTIEVELEAQPDACLPRGAELPDIIKHVRFALPASCRVISSGSRTTAEEERKNPPPRYVEVGEGPFQITATSPMSCTIPIVITWQDWIGQPALRLEHDLDFCRDGGSWDHGVDLHAPLSGSTLEELSEAQSDERAAALRTDALRLQLDRHESFRRPDQGCTTASPAMATTTTPTTGKKHVGMLSVASHGLKEMYRHLPKMRRPLRLRS